MKFSTATLIALPLASAFCPAPLAHFGSTKLGMSAALVTGPTGTAATSAEEDLALTLQIIMDHANRSSTVSKEQFVQQMEAAAAAPEVVEDIDISVPYNAAAMLAYEASDKSLSFEDFEPEYLADAVALVKSKQPVDISVPYNAAAKLAYEASDKALSFEDFEPTYLAEAVELVKSKQPVDILVPYNAAAKLAYEASDKALSFADFEPTYLAEAVELVKSKQPVDISVPYNAAAKLAFEASDKSMSYNDFETKYLADAVALVKSKQPEPAAPTAPAAPADSSDISVPYNAAAKLAYEASDKSISFADFEPKYLAEAVELVKSKRA